MENKKIIIAEKNEPFANGLEFLLEKSEQFIPVFIGLTKSEILNSTELPSADAIILDIDSGEINGKALLPQILEINPSIKTIALSIKTDIEYKVQCEELGFSEFCNKYYVSNELIPLLEKLYPRE